jgi:hypothetical protein
VTEKFTNAGTFVEVRNPELDVNGVVKKEPQEIVKTKGNLQHDNILICGVYHEPFITN